MTRTEIETLLFTVNDVSELGTRRTVAQVLEACNHNDSDNFSVYDVACIAFQAGLERGRNQSGNV